MLKKFAIGVGIILAVLVIGVSAVVGGVIWYAQSEMTYTEIDTEAVGYDKNHEFEKAGIVNIALFGVDARTPGEAGRSDSMMIATLNPSTKKLYLTSLMRDMLVPIDGHGYDKLNHAYAYGGAQEAMKVLNNAFDLNIQYYASVDFTSLKQVIDTLGGVAIDIDSEELSHMQPVGIYNTGVQTLNGEQALAYSRIRYASGGDYKRTERQQEVITSLASSLSQNGIQGAMNAASAVLPYIETNIDMGTMLSLGTKAMQIGIGNLTQQRYPVDGTFSSGIDPASGMWVINVDLDQMKQDLHQSFKQ